MIASTAASSAEAIRHIQKVKISHHTHHLHQKCPRKIVTILSHGLRQSHRFSVCQKERIFFTALTRRFLILHVRASIILHYTRTCAVEWSTFIHLRLTVHPPGAKTTHRSINLNRGRTITNGLPDRAQEEFSNVVSPIQSLHGKDRRQRIQELQRW